MLAVSQSSPFRFPFLMHWGSKFILLLTYFQYYSVCLSVHLPQCLTICLLGIPTARRITQIKKQTNMKMKMKNNKRKKKKK